MQANIHQLMTAAYQDFERRAVAARDGSMDVIDCGHA